jgi:methyl-accepting chemotaxis protein
MKGPDPRFDRPSRQGVKRVGESGDTLREILTQVAEINDLVGEIASSSKEQAVGLAEVNQAVNGLVPGEWREF